MSSRLRYAGRVLPVGIDLPEPLGGEVAAWIEAEAGWQPVSPQGPPTPVLVLATAPYGHERCVVLVDGQPDADQVRAGLASGALDVIGWPAERERLLDIADGAVDPPTDGPPVLAIAGIAGGAGTSTVTLATAGLLAWSGRRVIVVGGDDLVALCTGDAWSGPGSAEIAALSAGDAGAEVSALARQIPGLDHLKVLGGGGTGVVSTAGWPADLVVVDRRLDHAGAQLLVGRPDRSLQRAPAEPPVVLVGDGPLDRSMVRRTLGRKPLAWLHSSARVARAGLHARVPSSLPGSWLAELEGGLRKLRGTTQVAA